ncbi:MAG: hypothetical protein WCK65_14005 [Rhodospirillaceae bacterium]
MTAPISIHQYSSSGHSSGVNSSGEPDVNSAKSVLERYAAAKGRRSYWESYWQECYDYALPLGQSVTANSDSIRPPIPT